MATIDPDEIIDMDPLAARLSRVVIGPTPADLLARVMAGIHSLPPDPLRTRRRAAGHGSGTEWGVERI